MVSEPPASMANDVNVVNEKSVGRSLDNYKKPGKIPKKIHKAEREKLKRDQLNELFLELGQSLESARQNNGKASILGDTTRLLRDLLSQVECLRRENAVLVSESRYVTLEKNELRDENAVLGSDIEKLQIELRERMQSNPTWSNSVDAAPPALSRTTTAGLPLQQPPVLGPVYVIPLHQELQPYTQDSGNTPCSPNPPSNVARPQARYPVPSDSWPQQILSQQPRSRHEGEHVGNTSNTNNCLEEELAKK